MTQTTQLKTLFKAVNPVIKTRCVQLDLKGMPPTPERLVRLLEVFAAARYNAVLVEWEDSFPWTVDERFRSETAYSPDTVRKFVATAKRLKLEIIPLVQCLGHMETPLRLPEYARLREVSYSESGLNPLAPGARELVERMIDDVLRLMPNVRYFHLGGDEAMNFGTHPDTKKYIASHGKGALYLRHVEPLLDKLSRRKIRPLLWHDMMCDWNSAALRRLAREADLVVWGYRGDPDKVTVATHYRRENIEKFIKHGFSLWGATAYKGADGSDADLPDLAVREMNACAWTRVAKRYDFQGLIATAWSRWNTNHLQNEPIDGALDSALMVAVIMHDGSLPENGAEKCRQALARIGEGARFRKVYAALWKLTRARKQAWDTIKTVRQLIVTVTQDTRRLLGGNNQLIDCASNMRNILEAADAASHDLRKALAGLMEPIWIERYIAERVEPVREEFFTLKARIKQLNPVADNALFRDR